MGAGLSGHVWLTSARQLYTKLTVMLSGSSDRNGNCQSTSFCGQSAISILHETITSLLDILNQEY